MIDTLDPNRFNEAIANRRLILVEDCGVGCENNLMIPKCMGCIYRNVDEVISE
jgi:hypothetical protein